jgi:thiamine pyrophosphokinase
VERILILANGDWGTTEAERLRLEQWAADSDHVVAADGAIDRARAWGVRVDTLIGDLDSVLYPDGLERQVPDLEIIRYPQEKDSTDLELAVEWALDQSPEHVTLFGATGGRIDHTLANLALLERGLHAAVPMLLVDGDETVRLVQQELLLEEASVGDRVSLLPVSLFVTVSCEGLRYRLASEKLFRGWGRGVSNVVTESPVRISVETGVLAVVHAASGPAKR